MARIWVRVQDLPWGFFNTEWTIRIPSHFGLVEAIDNENSGLPHQPFLRARLVLDITKPLIPGCFLLEMANSAGQSSPSNPAHLVGRVGQVCKKPGPAQLEP